VAHFAEAGRDIAQMVRSLVQFLASNGMDRPAIERMKPYIARFITDVQAGKETIDVPGSDRNLEQDSGSATAEDGVGQAGVSSATGANGRSATAGGSPNYPRDERADLAAAYLKVMPLLWEAAAISQFLIQNPNLSPSIQPIETANEAVMLVSRDFPLNESQQSRLLKLLQTAPT
jgi:hypothetical protein